METRDRKLNITSRKPVNGRIAEKYENNTGKELWIRKNNEAHQENRNDLGDIKIVGKQHWWEGLDRISSTGASFYSHNWLWSCVKKLNK